MGVDVEGLPFGQRCCWSPLQNKGASLVGTRHRVAVMSRPVPQPAAAGGAGSWSGGGAAKLWQKHWVVIDVGKVSLRTYAGVQRRCKLCFSFTMACLACLATLTRPHQHKHLHLRALLICHSV